MKQISVKWKTEVGKKTYYGGSNLVEDDVADKLVADGRAEYLDENDKPKASKPKVK